MATEEALTALGDRVRRRRERLGMTIDEAAEEGGISPTTWSRVELARGVRRLTFNTVDRVLRWREGASLDFLEDGIEPDPPRDRSRSDEEIEPAKEDQFARLDRLYEEWKRDPKRGPVLEEILESWGDRDTA